MIIFCRVLIDLRKSTCMVFSLFFSFFLFFPASIVTKMFNCKGPPTGHSACPKVAIKERPTDM